jgi:aminopeptidase N
MSIPVVVRPVCTLLLAVVLSACSDNASVITAGVSLQLAQYRATVISEVNYQLYFDIPADQNEDIAGEATISFLLSDRSMPLQLDFRENAEKIHSVVVNGVDSDYRFVSEHIVIPASDLIAGSNAIEIRFTAGNSSLNRNPDYLYTLFVPDRARTAFPLFDQPDIKATYALTLAVPDNWQVMSNAPVDTISEAEGRSEFQFRKTDLISSYLFSFVAGKFELISREVDGLSMDMLHRESDVEKISRNLDGIFELHATSLRWLEEYTGIDYPYQKFGFALIPAFQYGGMEHVGAIQYRASSLFLDESPSTQQLLRRAGLIAHETAHMWFGNLVTMEWFNDVWTKDVFANFMAAKIVNPSFPDVNHDLNFLVGHYPRAYSVDRTEGANPIRQNLSNLNEAGQMYGAIIYNKAPVMMRQLEALIGADLFQEGLQEYLREFAFANATWPALIEILDARSAQDLQAWSDVWVNTAGRPEIEEQWETSIESGGGHHLIQHDPADSERVWPQRFSVAAFHESAMRSYDVSSVSEATSLPDMRQAAEDVVIFNANGLGYGLFPADLKNLAAWESLDDVQKGAELINVHEVFLSGAGPRVGEYLQALKEIVATEQNVLLLNLALEQLRSLYWHYLDADHRRAQALEIESLLWNAMLEQTDPSKTKIFFDAFADVASSENEIQKIYDIWSGSLGIENLNLSENDHIDIAQALAIKLPALADAIVASQIAQTENPDSVRKLRFIAPSLSADQAERDAFFASFADESNRQTESWVLDALQNLHHPLRTEMSEHYLLPSLEILQEIQVTGDIFFPKRWLDATLGNYQSATAVRTVRNFLEERPEYNDQLRMKILQSADTLFRASVLAESDRPNEP